MTADIECKKVSFSYQRDRRVLCDICLSVKQGESIGLIGANGVGKSTFLKLLVGLLDGYEGEIYVDGQSVNRKNLSEIRQKVGYVFQDSDSQLFMSTVYEDVAFGPRNYGCSEEETEQRVIEALQKVNIEHLRDRQIYRMSGGEKKLAAIATILSMEPQVILLDEPSIALDPRNRRNLIEILRGMPETQIIASHDLDMVLDTCERTVLLAEGRIIRQGETRALLSDKELLEMYGLELPLRMQGV
ncbi:MAG: energy-coupling factor ABC transporter ATP-binding protein [Clostridium sp.]|nr:energy-coupling factor ABC transporter ATP-binding protein [Clostridium sp.]